MSISNECLLMNLLVRIDNSILPEHHYTVGQYQRILESVYAISRERYKIPSQTEPRSTLYLQLFALLETMENIAGSYMTDTYGARYEIAVWMIERIAGLRFRDSKID